MSGVCFLWIWKRKVGITKEVNCLTELKCELLLCAANLWDDQSHSKLN